MSKKGLGKGLGAIFTNNETALSSIEEVRPDEKPIEVKITDIEPNPNQPRRVFDAEKLAELTESIKIHGVIQPLIVRKNGKKYEIVAGERRWRASQNAGLKKLPVILREYDDETVAEIALVENIQRHDLNPVEEAEGIKRLMSVYGLTQEEAAKRVGRSRTAIANILRILNLPQEILKEVSRETISMGQAKPLLALGSKEQQIELAKIIIEESLSARVVENAVQSIKAGKEIKFINGEMLEVEKKEPKNKKRKKEDKKDIFCSDFQEKMIQLLGTKVKVIPKNETQGKIEIDYYSMDDLARIYELLEAKKEIKIKAEKRQLTV